MGQSYRIRTELGVNKTLNIQLDQDFEFLEILSLAIQQTDIYIRACADYGVIVGRVTANNGFGLPNARVSVFIPIEQIDESNPVISSIYPYKSPQDKNEDGYRYNLLPYEASYTKHTPTGTLPSRTDALTGATAVEIYDKYYKFTSRTNESGDYMIMGVPVGNQQLVMDVDLSDIGEFSLTPQDLIRIGRATEAQVAGNRFRASTDLNSLPQIVNLTKTIEVAPLWGDENICQIAINRLDFDLRDDANIDIQPTAVFMGSMVSTADQFRVRRNAKPRDNMGNLCQLTTGPGQILALRQTIQQDSDGNPILEQYELEQAGNVIDGNGAWLVEVPMNLDYYTTNEFGEKVLSNDPEIGIPTKGRYRFKIKWQQPPTLTEQVRRPYFLVPNVKEYGWNSTGVSSDPNISNTVSQQSKQRLASSYYFGLDWSGYTQGFTGQDQINKLNSAIECEDTFYEMEFNRVYTVSGFIDEFKNGAKGRFIGIKEIDNQDCESTVNKFPVNDGFRNFDFLYFLFALLMQIIQLIGVPLLVIFHILAFLWNNFAVPFLVFIIAFFFRESIQNFVAAGLSFPALGLVLPFVAKGIINLAIAILCIINFRRIVRYKFGKVKVPMITYPDCQACECDSETTSAGGGTDAVSILTQLSNSGLYYEKLLNSTKTIVFNNQDDDNGTPFEDDAAVMALLFSQAMAGNMNDKNDNQVYKTPESQEARLPESGGGRRVFAYSEQLPYGERVNVFNGRKKYFDGVNKISVTFNYKDNIGKQHFDNTLTVLTAERLEPGSLYTFTNPLTSQDVNYLYTASTATDTITGISGFTKQLGPGNVNVVYCDPSNQTRALSLQYFLNTGSTEDNYKFPMDVEYYQVLTAITIQEAAKIWNVSNSSTFAGIMSSCTETYYNIRLGFPGSWGQEDQSPYGCLANYFEGFENQYITIFQRGVDPYSPKYPNRYGVGKIFGLPNETDIIITASTRLNIPIQPISSGLSVQNHRIQDNIFFPSYFFEATNQFSAFTTSKVGLYSAFDRNYFGAPINTLNLDGLQGIRSVSWNDTYDNSQPTAQYYDGSEDLSGVGMLYTSIGKGKKPKQVNMTYYAPSLYGSFTANPLNIVSKVNNVMRTDRLPNSDYLDGSGWGINNFNPVLQQNLGFTTFLINTDSEDFTSDRYGTGADMVPPDIEGQLYENEVITSLNTCDNMVSLSCYSGFGGNFGINVVCKETDPVEKGCYIMMVRPLLDLGKDLKTFSEWGFRFRFFYGLCRGVLSQSFVNNWVNGVLYTFPIQVDTFYDKQNKPLPPRFAKELVYFDDKTFNFYYRSSPWQGTPSNGTFIGRPVTGQINPVNKRNLLFPTTIINLGMKDSFYKEIIFEPSAQAYIMNSLNPSSYSDMSDLVNLFVISRITDETFLQRLISINGNNNLNQLFTRPSRRIDGDLAQAMSINSEFGVLPFSPEYYAVQGQNYAPVVITGTAQNPTMGIFYSSTTQDLQNKDYISPGVINFRPANNLNAITYPFNLKSQVVPFYQWKLVSSGTVFGTELNDWFTTDSGGITSYKYQGLSRRFTAQPSYFSGSYNNASDIYQRGYIFNIDQNQNYSATAGVWTPNFIVGAPNHFYFGLIKGESALDKFKTKYSVDE